MNKILFASCAGIFLTLTISSTANGQLAIANEKMPNDMSFYSRSVTKDVSTQVYRNNVSVRAFRDFLLKFDMISNETWYNAEDRFVATFTLNDIKYRIDYDMKGTWIQTIRSYDQTKLPPDVMQIVKGTYRDYNIFLVQEIEMPLHPVNYFVHLEGNGRLINLRIRSGETEELGNFIKSE